MASMTLRHADPVPSEMEGPRMRKSLTVVDAGGVNPDPLSLYPAMETVRALPEAVILCDRSSRVLMVNAGALHILGLSAPAEIGIDIARLLENSPRFTPAAVQTVQRAMVVALEGGDCGDIALRGASSLGCDLALLPGGVLLLRPRLLEPATPAPGVDPLTGLADRPTFLARLEEVLGDRGPRSCAILMLDFRSFRSVNEGLGHAAGDAVLREAACRLKAGLNARDLVARIGADEFAVLLPGAENASEVEDMARQLVARLSEPTLIDGHPVVMMARAGLALAPGDGTDATALLHGADLALAECKMDGQGGVRRFEPVMEQRAKTRHAIAAGLSEALDRRQFVLHYQPLMDLATERVMGFEALIRWNHPERGMIPPMAFIPVAEERGMIVAIGAWVLRTACAEAAGWPAPMTVAVNVAVAQFANGGLATLVGEALAASGLPGWRLEIEITESVALAQTEAVRAQIDAIRAMGVRIAVDDFGTGYSSLAQLRNLPFDRLKIDRSFVRELPAGLSSLAIIRAVAELGSALGLAITAEGVETQEQRDGLKAMGCTAAQGFYYGRPEPAVSVPGVLARLGGPLPD